MTCDAFTSEFARICATCTEYNQRNREKHCELNERSVEASNHSSVKLMDKDHYAEEERDPTSPKLIRLDFHSGTAL